MSNFTQHIKDLQESNQFRELNNCFSKGNGYSSFRGETMINLSGNDYLSLAENEALREEFNLLMTSTYKDCLNFSASSSRLLTGNHTIYSQLEELIAQLHQKEASLLFNSGYHANIGILPALTTKQDLILTDKLNHASIVDGIRLSNATVIRYKHLNYEQIDSILSARREDYQNVYIVTESIFSMDGDLVNIDTLVNLKTKYNCLIYLDEAHAVGVRGKSGLGIAEETNHLKDIDILVGTMGKALASQGAYGVFSEEIKSMLINTMRPLIFTTGLPPINIAWSHFIWSKLSSFTKERNHLTTISNQLKESLATLGSSSISESNIIPYIVGENETTIQLSNHLRKEGFLTFPIRPPTVPFGTSRLRFSLCANHTWENINRIPEIISTFAQ